MNNASDKKSFIEGDRNQLKNIKNIDVKLMYNYHEGKTGILCGSGPSLKLGKEYFDYGKKKNYLFFGNNHTVFENELFELDYHLVSDNYVFQKIPKRKWLDTKVHKEKIYVNNGKNVLLKDDELLKSNGISIKTNFNSLLDGLNKSQYVRCSSIFITLQIMVLMGLKKIYIAGCDCSFENNYIDRNFQNGIPNKRIITNWIFLKNYFKTNYQVDIYSINPVNLKNIIHEDPNFFS